MHLPRDVQMVALSATLREPESFLNWISSARGRPGELVTRKDRHVPLHVGGMERKTGSFVEFFGTHGARAQTFEMDKYNALCSALTTRSRPMQPPRRRPPPRAASEPRESSAPRRLRRARRRRRARGRRRRRRQGAARAAAAAAVAGAVGRAATTTCRAFNSECIKLGKALAATRSCRASSSPVAQALRRGRPRLRALNLIGGAGGGVRTPDDDASEEERIKWAAR